MKRPLFIGAVIVVCIAAGLGVMLSRRSRAALEPGILTERINALAAGWESQNIPAADRVVNIIVSDAQAGAPADKLSQKSGGESSGSRSVLDSEILSIADTPGLKSALVWFKRTFLRKTISAAKDSLLAESLGNLPNAVAWTHKGFEEVSKEEMASELVKAVIKADDAGAEVNIITQGISAAPALMAVKRLGEAARGKSIAVNKFVALDMNKPTLRKIDPGSFGKFKRPGNLAQWSNIWRSPSPPHRVTIELFSQSHNGKRFYADEIFLEMGLRLIDSPGPKATAAEENVLKFVRVLMKQVYVIEEVIDQLAQAARTRAEQKKAEAAAKELAGRAYKQGTSINAAERPASEPLDSLSAINIGWSEEVKAEVKKATWFSAVNYCKKNGGRLPTLNELKDMYKAECVGGRQAGTCGNWYWSSEVESACCAWGVDFYTGGVYRNIKGNDANAVRCMLDNRGSVTQSSCRRGTCRWYDAVDYCKGRGGLPNVNQLKNMYQAECTGGNQFNTCGKYYWSSEEAGADRARFVNFTSGNVHYGDKDRDNYYHARCVR